MNTAHPLRLPARPAAAHKGTFGTVLVVGGSVAPRRMLGGPALSAAAAMRAGCGLCELAMPAPLLDAALTILPTATGVPLAVGPRGEVDSQASAADLADAMGRATVVAIGPGLGAGPEVDGLVSTVVAQARSMGRPTIVDADALNSLSRHPPARPWSPPPPMIATPHPGEFRRLAAALGIDADPVLDGDRPAAARALAERLGAIVVLKGAGTIVCDGARLIRNPTGNAALATGGSGDILTGLIAGLAASWFASACDDPAVAAFDAAVAAVWCHGRAGELAADRLAAGRPAGVLATDLLVEIPLALAEAARMDRSSK